MIAWIKKQYVSIILVALLGAFVVTRVKVMLNERSNPAPQAKVSTNANEEGAEKVHHISDDKKEGCVGPSCGKTDQTAVGNEAATTNPTPTATATTEAGESPLVAKEKACDAKYNQECVDLAEMKEGQGDKAAALKLYQKACRPPEVDIEACGDAGRLLSFSEADQARRDCEQGQLHLCLSVAGYYFERSDKAEAKKWTD